MRRAGKQPGSRLGERGAEITICTPVFSRAMVFLWHSMMQNTKWSAPRARCAGMNRADGTEESEPGAILVLPEFQQQGLRHEFLPVA